MAEPEKNSLLNDKQIESIIEFIKKISPTLGKWAEVIPAGIAAGPIGVTAAVAGEIHSSVSESLDEQNAKNDKQAEQNARPLGTSTADLKKHIEDAKKALDDFQASLARAGVDTDPIGTHVKRSKEIADQRIETAKKEAASQGRLEEATLRGQGATSEQIVASEQRTQKALQVLDEQKRLRDGTGTLKEEQNERQSSQANMLDDAVAAFKNEDKTVAANNTLHDAIKNLTGQTGQGKEDDPGYVLDQKRIAAASEDFAFQQQYKKHEIEKARESGATDDDVQEIATGHDLKVIDAQHDLKAADQNVQNKSTYLEQLKKKVADSDHQTSEAIDQKKDKLAQAQKNESRLNELPAEIQHAEDLDHIVQTAESLIQTRDATTDKLKSAVSIGADEHGQPGVETSPLVVERFNSLLTNITAGQNELLRLIDSSLASQATLAEKIQSLQNKHSAIEDQIHALQSSGLK